MAGLTLPNGMGQQPVAMQVATPINDIQLIALVAASVYSRNETLAFEDAVTVAVNLVAEAVVQGQDLPNLVRLKRQALERSK